MTGSPGLTISQRLRTIAVLLSLFAALYRLVRGHHTNSFDRAVTTMLQSAKSPAESDLLHLVSWPGFPPQSRTIPWLLPLLWFGAGFRREALFQLAGWGTGLVSFLVKRRMRRPRPDRTQFYYADANIGGTSFPSGHVINYIGVYGTFAFLVSRNVSSPLLRRLVLLPVVLLLILVGPSRIYLGHHWATDTIASYLLGGSYLLALSSVYDTACQWTTDEHTAATN